MQNNSVVLKFILIIKGRIKLRKYVHSIPPLMNLKKVNKYPGNKSRHEEVQKVVKRLPKYKHKHIPKDDGRKKEFKGMTDLPNK